MRRPRYLWLLWALILFAAFNLSHAQRGGTTGTTTPVTGGCGMQVVTAPITGTCSSCIIQVVATTGIMYCCNTTWDVCGTTAAIGSDSITPDMVKSASQTDEYCLTYEATGDTWAWQPCDPTSAALSKGITLSSPTASEDATIWYTKNAITVTQITAVRVGGSAFTFTIRFGPDRNAAGTEVKTGGIAMATGNPTTTGIVTTSLSNASIPANNFVWLESSVSTGPPTDVNVTIWYTEP